MIFALISDWLCLANPNSVNIVKFVTMMDFWSVILLVLFATLQVYLSRKTTMLCMHLWKLSLMNVRMDLSKIFSSKEVKNVDFYKDSDFENIYFFRSKRRSTKRKIDFHLCGKQVSKTIRWINGQIEVHWNEFYSVHQTKCENGSPSIRR